jgi:hypothetical protein
MASRPYNTDSIPNSVEHGGKSMSAYIYGKIFVFAARKHRQRPLPARMGGLLHVGAIAVTLRRFLLIPVAVDRGRP